MKKNTLKIMLFIAFTTPTLFCLAQEEPAPFNKFQIMVGGGPSSPSGSYAATNGNFEDGFAAGGAQFRIHLQYNLKQVSLFFTTVRGYNNYNTSAYSRTVAPIITTGPITHHLQNYNFGVARNISISADGKLFGTGYLGISYGRYKEAEFIVDFQGAEILYSSDRAIGAGGMIGAKLNYMLGKNLYFSAGWEGFSQLVELETKLTNVLGNQEVTAVDRFTRMSNFTIGIGAAF